MSTKIFRPEHPNPMWERQNWQNLNGEWEFELDFSKSALDRSLYKSEKPLKDRINVPFCPESDLSGIGYKDFIPAVCYRRSIVVDKNQLSGRVVLHIGACDYKTNVFINCAFAGSHIGGYTPFELDITEKLHEGENTVFIHAADDTRDAKTASGKQSEKSYSYGCMYTRTTGIWQTVWLEFVPEHYIMNAKYICNTDVPSLTVEGTTNGTGRVEAEAFLDGKSVGKSSVSSTGNFLMTINLSEKKLWEVGKGGLYDLKLTFGDDSVSSYFGLRTVGVDGYNVLINGKKVFQRLVLDQGFYPDGIYTAKDEKELENDIILSMNAGFNGARLHEKVFEPRFLYYADKHGYITWGECPNWGISDYGAGRTVQDFAVNMAEEIQRDFNHPSIVGWCPFNETWGYAENNSANRILETVYRITKALDTTRPCIDTSGNFHVITDIYDLHDYDQNPESFRTKYSFFAQNGDFSPEQSKTAAAPFFFMEGGNSRYEKGKPFFISEYGGIKWDLEMLSNDQKASWGYGDAPKTEEEFFTRLKGLTDALLDNPYMFGFCYTQLTDVEQERNGVYAYDRKPKFDIAKFREIFSAKAKYED